MPQFICTIENCDRAFWLEGLRDRHSAKPHEECPGCQRAFVAGSGLTVHKHQCPSLKAGIVCAGHQKNISLDDPHIHAVQMTLVREPVSPGKHRRRNYHDLYFCGPGCIMLWANQTAAVFDQFASSDAPEP